MHNESHSQFAAIGLLCGAAGAVLVTELDNEALEALNTGNFDKLPSSCTFLKALSNGAEPTGDVGRNNEALLAGDAKALSSMAEQCDHDESLRVHLVCAAYRLGSDIELPADSDQIDPRVRAYLMATKAHELSMDGEHKKAAELLTKASQCVESSSPAAAARLVGEAAVILADAGIADARILLDLERAADSLEGSGFTELRGELLISRASLLMERGGERPAMLQEAIQCYQKATQTLSRKDNPVAYAMCHVNVAVAYLSMPMNQFASKLRAAIAVQSLREALEILTADEYPELWQMATLNLANALQHLPSSHTAENLLESVSLYEELLKQRTEPDIGRARLLANLGNALAHLGQFSDAEPWLNESKAFFESINDSAAIEGIDGVLAEMKEKSAINQPVSPGHE